MQNPFPHIISNNTFWVSSERCLWWEEENTMIVADLHLGKTGHFRKEGIGIPGAVYKADLQRLMAQLYFFKADRLIIVGDFTHSVVNNELDHFKKWRKDFSLLHIDLIRGNHDILADDWYADADVQVVPWHLDQGPFCFRHDLKVKKDEPAPAAGQYLIAGHLHPAITIRGKGRQSLRFPCFYFTPGFAVLPAFSRFTGTYRVEKKKNETVYAIADNQLIEVT